jgi:hypothetical protein
VVRELVDERADITKSRTTAAEFGWHERGEQLGFLKRAVALLHKRAFGIVTGGVGPSTTTCGPADVGVYGRCDNDEGIADLIGNVAEWIFSCAKTEQIGDPEATCKRFGGSYQQGLASATCSTVSSSVALAKNSRVADLGFRCCVELSNTEETQVD